MKNLIRGLALTLVGLTICQTGFAQSALDMTKLQGGNVMNGSVPLVSAKPTEMQKIDDVILEDEKIHCDKGGMCEFFVSVCHNTEIKFGISAGEGNNLGGTGGVNIYDGEDQQNNGVSYTISGGYTNSTSTNTVRIDPTIYRMIKKYLEYFSTDDNVKNNIQQRETVVPEAVKMALSAAVAFKETPCSSTQTTYSH